jgi:hypothetical protein
MIKSRRVNTASVLVSRFGESHQGQHVRTGHWIITAVRLAIVVWYGVNVWTRTPSMTAYGYVAMGLGTIVAIAIGVGLMALARSGHSSANSLS